MLHSFLIFGSGSRQDFRLFGDLFETLDEFRYPIVKP